MPRHLFLASATAFACLGLATMSCNQAILTAPPGSTIKLIANPTIIATNGGVSVISAIVIEQAGTLVPDGTVVQFFTSLGQIAPQGKTNDGVARVNLVAGSRSGTAEVSAYSGGVAATSASPGSGSASGGGATSATISVLIGAVNAKTIVLTANPPRILAPSRTSQIVATVYDTDGNPLPNAPVTFTVNEVNTSQPAYREYMSSQGNPVFTDNNGRAYDQLNTNRPVELGQRIVEVKAATPTAEGTTIEKALQVQIY